MGLSSSARHDNIRSPTGMLCAAVPPLDGLGSSGVALKNSIWRYSPCRWCGGRRKNSTPPSRETAALHDFSPASVRFGLKAEQSVGDPQSLSDGLRVVFVVFESRPAGGVPSKQSADAVATSREGHRSPTAGPAVVRRRSDRGLEPVSADKWDRSI